MNKQRRKELGHLIDGIEAMREQMEALRVTVSAMADDLENLRDEEQEAFDSLPESLQLGEKGQDMEIAIDQLTTALDSLETLRDAITEFDGEDVARNIDDARGEG